jgi:hypothetical protein
VFAAVQAVPFRPPLLLCARRLPRLPRLSRGPSQGDLCVEASAVHMRLLHLTSSFSDTSALFCPNGRHLTLSESVACALFSSQRRGVPPPAKILFVFPLFLESAHSFTPTPVGATKLFGMNTCRSVSKQTTLNLFRMNTCEKHGGGYVHPSSSPKESHPAPVARAPRATLCFFRHNFCASRVAKSLLFNSNRSARRMHLRSSSAEGVKQWASLRNRESSR